MTETQEDYKAGNALTPWQRLSLRLANYPRHTLRLTIVINASGIPTMMVIEDLGKTEELRPD